MESRTRHTNASDSRLMTVMKGAEKRALDFYNDAANSTKKVVQSSNSISGSNLTQGEAQAYKTVAMLKSGALSPVKASQQAVEASFTNGGDPKTFKNVVGVGSIGVSLIVSAAIACHNSEAITQINSEKPVLTTNKQGESIQVLNIKELTETHDLLKKQNIIPKNLDFNLKNIKDIKTLKANMDVYGRRNFGREVFSLSKDDIEIMLGKFIQEGNEEAVKVLSTALSIKDLSDTPQLNLFESKALKYKVSKLARNNMPKDDYISDGYRRLVNTKFQIKMSMKIAKYSVKLDYKLYGYVVKGSQKVMQNISHQAQANGHLKVAGALHEINKGIDNTRFIINDTTNKIIQTQRNISSSYKDMKTLLPQEIKSKVFSGNARKASKTVTGAERASQKVVNQTSKTATKKITKKTIKKTSSKVVKKVTFGTIKKAAIHAVSEVVQWLTGIKEIIIAVLVALLLAAIVTEIPLVMVTSVTAIGDAVSKTFEDFKEKTSMGAAYDKLIDKEEKFSAALQSLITSEKPPATIVGYYENASGETISCNIPAYTKSSINYYNGNGETPSNTQTIQGILAMAAVYIDQDFAKYGAFLEGIGLTDSVYKEYCEKLYQSSHIIGIESADANDVYYCPNPDEADIACNNIYIVDHGSSEGNPPSYCDAYKIDHYRYDGCTKDEEGNSDCPGHPVYVCSKHHRCGGHLDLNAEVVISNISYPKKDESKANNSTDGDDSEESTDDGMKVGDAKPETNYSMYILDKYATAFKKSDDNQSAVEADERQERDAELNILETITGKNIERLVEWDSSNSWWPEGLSTETAYYRLKDDGDINNPDDPVANTNSTPYWFKSYTSSNKRNEDFERHGWDENSISMVRLLLTADWEELYGIKSFGGGIVGTPLSEEQIEALIANHPEWQSLSPARKAIMATCLTLPLGHPYSREGLPTGKYGTPGELCCAGFVKWIYWSVFDMADFPNYTGGMNNSLPIDPRFETYRGANILDIAEPGDIIMKRDGGSDTNDWGRANHTLIYAGKNEQGQHMFFHESGKYKYSTYSNISSQSILYRLKGIDSMSIDYGYGSSNFNKTDALTGWTVFESGTSGGYKSVYSNSSAFGAYQFDHTQGTVQAFIDNIIKKYPDHYATLNSLKPTTRSKPSSAFENEWLHCFNTYTEEFCELQDEYAYNAYYKEGEEKSKISLENRPDVVKGTIWSISVRKGPKEVASATKKCTESMTDKEVIDVLYNYMARNHPDGGRWNTSGQYNNNNGPNQYTWAISHL